MAKDPGRVLIFDTTLRDGEQSPGCSMNLEEKLKVFETLQSLNVDIGEIHCVHAQEVNGMVSFRKSS